MTPRSSRLRPAAWAVCLVALTIAVRGVRGFSPTKAPTRVPFLPSTSEAPPHPHPHPQRAPPLPPSHSRIRRLLTELASTSVHPDAADKDDSSRQPILLPAIAVAVQDAFRELDDLYARTSSIRCPFWRRRAADSIDSLALVARFLLIRHKSLGVLDPLWDLEDGVADSLVGSDALQPPGCKPLGFASRKVAADGTALKHRHLPIGVVADSIRADWISGPDGRRGYYITGRLNSTLYCDDCLFDGPDPDMPVRGLRKYLSAASHLFDAKDSHAKLLSLKYEEGGGRMGNGMVEVRWRLDGTLMLPWRPKVRPWTGTTRYHLNDEGLVYLHEEGWDISVWEAFVCTVWPEVGERIWGEAKAAAEETEPGEMGTEVGRP